ncbi:LPXTG cell wall anchor domain-containing protein [Thomasclavelia cocleata]
MKTGDSSSVGIFIGLSVLSILGLRIFKKRKYFFK